MNVVAQPIESPRPAAVEPRADLVVVDRYVDVPRIPGSAGRVIYLLVALTFALVVWASLAKIDVVIVSHGKLTAPTQQISMQVFETSVVKSVDVKIGQSVKKGQTLATLDPTFTTADRSDLENQVAAVTALTQRQQAEIDGRIYDPENPTSAETVQRLIFLERRAEYASHMSSLDKKISELKAQLAYVRANKPLLTGQLKLIQEIVAIDLALTSKGLGNSRQLAETKGKELEALSKLAENQKEESRFEEQIGAAEADRDSYSNEWSRKLAEDYQKSTGDKDSASAKLAKAARRGELIAMTAPVDGSILDIPKKNVGSVLREGDTLMTLVPAGTLMPVDVAIETKDIAYLHVGQKVRIKFEALPYQEYGTAEGTLTALTADTTADSPISDETGGARSGRQDVSNRLYYRGLVSIDREAFRNLPADFQLRPGMKASGEIKVGLRTVTAYILHPITRVFDESLRER